MAYSENVEATNILKLLKQMQTVHKQLTLLPFFIKCASISALQYANINSVCGAARDDDGYASEFVIKKDHNFSIGVSSAEGMLFPNIKQIQNKSILQINEELIKLRERASKGLLNSDDFEEGTFAVVGELAGAYCYPTILSP